MKVLRLPGDCVKPLLMAACSLILVVGCSKDRERTTVETVSEKSTDPPTSEGAVKEAPPAPSVGPEEAAYGYTYGLASGNRVVRGEGKLPEAEPVDVALSGATPAWVAGVPLGDDTAWAIAHNDGEVEAFRLDDASDQFVPWFTMPDHLASRAPPLLATAEGHLRLVSLKRASPLTHPVRAGSGVLGVTPEGRLVSDRGEDLAVSTLPDARIVEAENGSLAVLSDPTTRYGRGLLGDELEAGSITVLDPERGGYAVAGTVRPESGGVFETLSPLWFRTGAGEDEVLALTESAEGKGSRISVYSPKGALVAAGPFVGEPQGWRHLIAAGPFGPEGQVELAAVRNPHVGGPVEFYRMDRENGELRLAASGGEYLSHTLYSRNLDAARAGDLDGDGSWELLLPNASYTALEAVRHKGGGVETAWRLPLGGTLATNLASATDSEGRVALAAGTAEGKLRIWR